jgi:hypothetical protein
VTKKRGDLDELEPELQALVRPGPLTRRMPPELRGRVLARARETAAGKGLAPPAPLRDPPALSLVPSPLPSAPPALSLVAAPPAVARPSGRARIRVAFAAAAMVAAVALGAVAARAIGLGQAALRPVRPLVISAAAPEPGTAWLLPERVVIPPLPAAAPPRRLGRRDRLAAELALLARAQAAYTRHDYAAALASVAEHARRFPRGPLAEEREALRVRSLAAAGHVGEARWAAARFATRFPRSVLLPRVDPGDAE